MSDNGSLPRRLGAAAVLAALGAGALGASAGTDHNVRPGLTRPSDQRDITFNGPGVVSNLTVKEGDAVTAGQPVIDQDDSVEQATLAVIEVEATSKVQTEAAEAKLAYQKVELARKQKMFEQKVLGQSELEEAQVDVIIAAKQVELTEQERHQKELEAIEQRKKIGLKHLVSPISGVIAKINTHVGEAPVADKPTVSIVQNDPLWVEVDLPTEQVKAMKMGQSLDVKYNDEDKWMAGKVIFIAPVADARSDTNKVRLEMPNPRHRNSGLQVQVKSPENVASANSSAR